MPPAKFKFMKRGEGISRFSKGGMAEARKDYVTRHNVAPVATPSEEMRRIEERVAKGLAPAMEEPFPVAAPAAEPPMRAAKPKGNRGGAAWVVGEGEVPGGEE